VDDLDEIRQLEERLLQVEVRRSEQQLSQILASTFMEIGSSGTVWNKDQIIRNLQGEQPARRVLDEFHAQALAPGVVLATYRVKRFAEADDLEASSLRSSIWVLRDGRWQMAFHQGTAQRLP